MQQVNEALKFKQWQQALASNGLSADAPPTEHYTLRRHNGEVLFALVEAHLHTPEKRAMPGLCLLRGSFVSVVTVLKNSATGERKLLLVRQRRICNGAWFYEHPAGMMDSEHDPAITALKELEEETGLTASREQLHALNTEPLYSSPGVLDEGGYYFWIELMMTPEQLAALQGAQHGAADESEYIELHLATLNEAIPLLHNGQALTALFLYLRATGQAFS